MNVSTGNELRLRTFRFFFFVLHKNFKHNICIFCRHLKCKFSRDSCNASHIFRNASKLMERKEFDALSLLSQFIYAILVVAITFTLSGFQRVLLFVLDFSIAFALFLNFLTHSPLYFNFLFARWDISQCDPVFLLLVKHVTTNDSDTQNQLLTFLEWHI